MASNMNTGFKHKLSGLGAVCAGLIVSAACNQALADDRGVPVSILASSTLQLMQDPAEAASDVAPIPLIPEREAAGLNFDLGGSETRKLQLQLNQPITLTMGSQARTLGSGSSLLGLDATLDVPVGNGFSLTGGAARQAGTSQFQSLGSIQCLNGTLTPDSYTAAGCRFVNEPYGTMDRQQYRLGASYFAGPASASINWFTQKTNMNQAGAGMTSMNSALLTPTLGNPLAPGGQFAEPLRFLNSEASGIDLNFRVGITTDNAGDIRLGLALTRMLDTGYQGIYANGSDVLDWSVAEPFNTARMDIGWSRGSFSSGIQGFYREPVNFLDRNSLDSTTTFDVHFTWRTPWNADLSVGASNVLNSGVDDGAVNENQATDPFESIYGRIPYVRYKQDL
jgi:hypothetical protein